jgi:hypothetical protein
MVSGAHRWSDALSIDLPAGNVRLEMQLQGLSKKRWDQSADAPGHMPIALSRITRQALAATLAISLGGCSFASEALFPSILGDGSASAPMEPIEEAAPREMPAIAAVVPTSNFGPTAVGQKASQFRDEFEDLRSNTDTRMQQLDSLRAQTIDDVQSYHNLVGGIRSRLQMGSTPGNPELLERWGQAQTQLAQIDANIAALNQLSALVSGDAGTSAYLLENIRAAFGLSGALDEDHLRLRVLEDEVSQNAILVDRALLLLNDEINRQQQYLTEERASLVRLASDINAGQSYTIATQRSAAPAWPVASVTPASIGQRRALVIIRFDKPDVAYEPALYQALSRALASRPDAIFDLVAVSPQGGNPASAQQSAESVFQSMTNMGLPAERVAMAAMGSTSAINPEVHIYVR